MLFSVAARKQLRTQARLAASLPPVPFGGFTSLSGGVGLAVGSSTGFRSSLATPTLVAPGMGAAGARVGALPAPLGAASAAVTVGARTGQRTLGSGTASSIAFTPYQGMELLNPTAAAPAKFAKYFDSL